LEVNPAPSIGGYLDVADADVVEACGLSESRLATRVRCLEQVGRRPLGNSQRFRCERGHKRFIKAEQERDPAHNLIAISYPVECADSACCSLELGKVAGGPFKLK